MVETSPSQEEGKKPWSAYTVEDLKRSVFGSTDSASRPAPSLPQNSSSYFLMLQVLFLFSLSSFTTFINRDLFIPFLFPHFLCWILRKTENFQLGVSRIILFSFSFLRYLSCFGCQICGGGTVEKIHRRGSLDVALIVERQIS